VFLGERNLGDNFMKHLSIVMLAFSVACFSSTNLFSAAPKFQPIPNRAPTLPTPQNVRAVGKGGCFRVCFSACCKSKTVTAAVNDFELVHNILSIGLIIAPGPIQELYLKCSSVLYSLSTAAAERLDAMGFLDGDGNLKEGWRQLVLASLQNKAGALDPADLHFQQAVANLVTRYPAIVAELRGQAEGGAGITLAPEVLALLKNEYNIIADGRATSATEIGKILQFVDALTPPAPTAAPTLTRSASTVDVDAPTTSRTHRSAGYETQPVVGQLSVAPIHEAREAYLEHIAGLNS
jgi:hypothetical protein